MDTNTKIGWIGTGVMGSSMSGHLLSAGYDVFVYTRTKIKADDLLKQGAVWCDSAAAVAQASDVIFTMVGTPDEVESIYFGDNGIFSVDVANKSLVDMGTTSPSLTLKIHDSAENNQAFAIDAPVSGGDVGAQNASLTIMAGGDEKAIQALQPLFSCMGSVKYMGETGSGQHTKMCNQLLAAGSMIGVCEALVYAQKAGLDCERMIAAISPGAAGCWALDNLAPRIVKDDYEPGFMVDHFVKDLGIALKQSESMGLKLPGLALANQLYQKTQALGFGENGSQVLIKAIREMGD